jgi:hypothetical protein
VFVGQRARLLLPHDLGKITGRTYALCACMHHRRDSPPSYASGLVARRSSTAIVSVRSRGQHPALRTRAGRSMRTREGAR